MVNSISKTVQNLIDEDLSLQDALQRDYANHSAIARILLPKIQESHRNPSKHGKRHNIS